MTKAALQPAKTTSQAARPYPSPSGAKWPVPALEQEFREQLVGYLPQLTGVARAMTRSREAADDLVQEAVTRALGAYAQFQPGTNLRAWLMTILRNQYISELRKRHPTVTDTPIADTIPTPATQMQRIELAEVNAAMTKMSERHREVLMLVAVSEMDQEEAAQICHCAIGTIKSRLNRARSELQLILADHQTGGRRGTGETRTRSLVERGVRPTMEGRMKIHEIMTREVEVAHPGMTLEEAAMLMESLDVGMLPVGKDDRLVGTLTDRDIAIRCVAKGKRADTTLVGDVMSENVRYCFDDEEVDVAATNMTRLQIRRLPVINRSKRLVGIVSLSDIALRHSSDVAGATLEGVCVPDHRE